MLVSTVNTNSVVRAKDAKYPNDSEGQKCCKKAREASGISYLKFGASNSYVCFQRES